MPFVANTPESLLGRSDSKDPNSTCRGITSNGRPCRRSIPRPTPAALRPSQPDPSDESLYCWQHKEQASRSAHSSPGPRSRVQPILEEQTSMDTLADRLGLIDVSPTGKEKRGSRPKPATGRTSSKPHGPPKMTRPKPKQRLSFCFCFSVPLDEVQEAAPPRPRPMPRPLQQHAPSASVPDFGKPQHKQRISASTAAPEKNTHASKNSTASQTAQFKTLIPDSLDSVTASALMAELCRPPSDVVSQFADAGEKGGHGKMLLKIGRAANVQRRMNQWQRQCGHDIEMLRYYPYLPGSSDASATGQMPRMTPHCRRIERLIHIELSGMGLRAALSTCEACGRDHREWFEVDPSRDAVGKVDEVIRRWVNWDETTA
ncbi:hypothetical protein HIM_03527 [Hirsutella minnesotensis 3608]|uniref:Bacteriophage T5 Orf172 DNA-binding domain-containing protein n=1 Tax=Hirsutella minnesotensis 3608 TaxID=1043627 RepID=A0A0F7ZMF9_9HYPO|nr:hypothetical protein HIM_03527 [Hirsutella minnesotensis 3608]